MVWQQEQDVDREEGSERTEGISESRRDETGRRLGLSVVLFRGWAAF